ncbi:MFS transporter [Sphaerisporangium krabiense]|uniref:MFS family permease n=1 Tax=Sphaerisporangium krabiense TaxID=763782 RepID=A0A7W8Z3Q5_9ACTN|nr:MFS transporter [Sphaerisporangium krabiense]MBB5626894.1 MFS family permease [Sphaerisporangium krabiense]
MSRWDALRAYSALPATTGPWFLAVTLIGRVPASMGQLGALLLVSGATGSLALGGATASAFAVGQAAGGPLVGRAADRYGHRPAGLAAALLHTAALVLLVVCVERDAPTGAALLAAVVAGFSVPQVGPLSRARWTALAHHGRLPMARFPAAMSFEGTGDEFAFVLGPALVGVIATATSPPAAVLVAAGLTVTMCVAFALHPTAAAVTRGQGRGADAAAPVLRVPVFLLAAGLTGLGCYFGAVQAGVTWRAVDAGADGAAGLIYAVLGLSSALAGVLVPMLPASFPLARRLQVGFVLLAVLTLPLAIVGGFQVGGLWPLGLLIVLPGVTIAPILVTAYTQAEMTVPVAKISWVMTVLTSAVVVGYAIGAFLSGTLADRYGPLSAFLLALGAAGVGIAASGLGRRRLAALRPGGTPHHERNPAEIS